MMKLVLDERVKHRLIGLAVILSIAAIFAPAIMKKSNQRFDGNVSVSVDLPPKPLQPNIEMAEKKALFETVKVAHVEINDLPEQHPVSAIAKAEPLSPLEDAMNTDVFAPAAKVVSKIQTPVLAKAKLKPVPAPAVIKVAKQTIKTPPRVIKPKVVAQKAPLSRSSGSYFSRGGYAVQLATFSKQRNADILISKLRAKGYRGIYNKVRTNQGIVYKVLVGQVNQREQAQALKQQLASAVQIRGFVVSTGQG